MLYPGHVAESIIQDDMKSHHSGVIQQGVEMAQLILMEGHECWSTSKRKKLGSDDRIFLMVVILLMVLQVYKILQDQFLTLVKNS